MTVAFFIAVWKFMRSIPWKVWAIIAVIAAVYLWGEHRHRSGIAAENSRWEAAQAASDRKALEAQKVRAIAASKVNTGSTTWAAEVVAETRTQTATSVERVKHDVQTIVVPGNCPTTLPDRVRKEGRAAVDRARTAGNQVRAGANH